MIPVGTLCYVVWSPVAPVHVGRVVTVVEVSPLRRLNCPCPNCRSGSTVCRVVGQDRRMYCVDLWRCLRPIVPPAGERSPTVTEKDLA